MSRLLIVEDEFAMRRGLEDLFTAEGHRVLCAADGDTGLAAILREKPDLVVLDVMLPKRDGFSIAQEVRRHGSTVPILLLTAKGGVGDRVAGLDAGADDYLAKPFSPAELLARVRALLRRSTHTGELPRTLKLGDVTLDFVKQISTRLSTPRSEVTAVPLSPKEFAMLRLLAAADGGVVSREQFLDLVWGYGAFPTHRTVDNYILSLRQKLEPDHASPRFLLTVHGQGYRLGTAFRS